MIKLTNLFLLLVSASVSTAQSIGISIPVHAITHPISAYHDIIPDRNLIIGAISTLEIVNAADYGTTYRGVVQLGGCEQNPLFTLAPCVFNAPRFTGVKIAVAAAPIAQFLPVWLGWHNSTYIKSMAIVDLLGSAPLAGAVGNNVWVLSHWRK
jgi:hypothetical protein